MSDFCPIPNEIRRSSRKTLSIEVTADGRLVVHAPRFMLRGTIDHFLAEKADWIAKKQQAVAKEQTMLPPITDGAVWRIGDSPVRLRLESGLPCAVWNAQTTELCLPTENAKAALITWLKAQALPFLTQQTQAWAAKMGVRVAAVKISNAKTQWGSCNSKGVAQYRVWFRCCPAGTW